MSRDHCTWLLVGGVSLSLSGCLIEVNPLFEPDAVGGGEDTTGTDGGGSEGSGSGDGDTDTTTTTTGDGDCTDPEAPGSGQCPVACTSCVGNVCRIDCIGNSACEGVDIVCPQNYECVVICDGLDACDTGSVTCPDLYACSLTCEGGVDACGDLPMVCGEGSCTMNCGPSNAVCMGASVECGAGACTATCLGGSQPMSMPGCDAACSCAPC
jgi:hypothetical protein